MTPPIPKSNYALHKPLSNNLYLVRRTTDGELFVAHPLDATSYTRAPNRPPPEDLAVFHSSANPFDNSNNPNTNPESDHAKTTELIRRGAGAAAAGVLNHENLVSVHDELVNFPLPVNTPAGGGRECRMFLWDWCDAGTLQDVFAAYEGTLGFDGGEGFLPEGFVWHVAVGMLRALQWLHEGVRDVYGVEKGRIGGGRCRRVRGRREAERDWMPVLHRDVRAENVFLQHPRGIETYGAVKLGNFGRCFVSGSVSKSRETPVMAMKWEDASLGELRERKAKWARSGLDVYKPQRPYTEGSELFALGAILYRMMCGRELPRSEECTSCGCIHIISRDAVGHKPCTHACVGDVYIDKVFQPLTSYTNDLKDLVALLLRLNRNDEWRASTALNIAWEGYENWTANTEDGMLHRDIFDDIWFRKQNETRMRKRQREAEDEFMDVDWDAMGF